MPSRPKLPLERKQLQKSPQIQCEFSSQVAVFPSVCSIWSIIISALPPYLADCCAFMGEKKNIQPVIWAFALVQDCEAKTLQWCRRQKRIKLTMTVYRGFRQKVSLINAISPYLRGNDPLNLQLQLFVPTLLSFGSVWLFQMCHFWKTQLP